MKRTALAFFLVLCLLAGCSTVMTADQTALPASVIPLDSQSPEVSAVLSVSTDPEVPDIPLVSGAPEVSAVPSVSLQPEAPAAPPPSPETTLTDEDYAQRLDQIFAGWPEFSGSVLIEKEGRVLLCKGYGMSDAEKGIKNTPDSKYLVGSVTKQFTAMAVMQLYEGGLLDIHDRLSKYIPEFTRGGDIALTNLLTQTSGITDFLNDDPKLLSAIPYGELSEKNIIGLVKAKPLKFEPGSKYSYSNTNYLILGYIVQKVSGLSYGDYLERNIFKPLGMTNTGVFDPADPPENMATGHKSFDSPVLFRTQGGDIDISKACSVKGSFGAGCLYSTVGDLHLWDQALSTEKLLSRKYMAMIFARSVPVEGALITSAYGFGWVIQSDTHIGTINVHTGALGGFRAYNGIFADKNMKVIVLLNTMSFPDRDELIPAVKHALFPEAVRSATEVKNYLPPGSIVASGR